MLRRIALFPTLLATSAMAQCPVDLFREYDPTRPPLILTALPIRQIAITPYVDPDSEPAGTYLTYYRLNTRVDPDPLVPIIHLVKTSPTMFAIHWSEVGPATGACCDGTTCTDRCAIDCAIQLGVFKGNGTACTDTPPPCDNPNPTCTNRGPLHGLSKPDGGGISLGGSGFPTLGAVTLRQTDATNGATSSLGLTLTPEEQRVWNWTGAHDRSSAHHYYAGGRFGHATIAPTLVTVDTATRTLRNAPILNPPVNLLHLDIDDSSGRIYGLAIAGGGHAISSGHVHFPGSLDLVQLDPLTGGVTPIRTGLPGDLEHFAATFDSDQNRYIYHSFEGLLHIVDVVSGANVSIPSLEHYVDLLYDDATRTLYGLRTTGTSLFSISDTTGYRTEFILDLVRIDQATASATVLNLAPLPIGTTNWSAGFDCDLGHYLYVSYSGETQVLDVATGQLVSSSPPPIGARLHSLD